MRDKATDEHIYLYRHICMLIYTYISLYSSELQFQFLYIKSYRKEKKKARAHIT